MFRQAICGLGFLAACVSSAAADETMSARQILKLAPGTFQAVVKGKYQLTVVLGRDGSAVGKAQGMTDKGRWTVRNNQLCIVLPTWTRGQVKCSTVIADNGWYHSQDVSFRRL